MVLVIGRSVVTRPPTKKYATFAVAHFESLTILISLLRQAAAAVVRENGSRKEMGKNTPTVEEQYRLSLDCFECPKKGFEKGHNVYALNGVYHSVNTYTQAAKYAQ